MLGHEVPFAYCREPGGQTPCRKVFDCWWETFDVEAFMRCTHDEEMIERILQPRQDKVTTLVQLIEQARARMGGGAPASEDGSAIEPMTGKETGDEGE